MDFDGLQGNLGADITNPQSWNAYAYALNSPLVNIDPDGTDTCVDGSTASVCVVDTPPPDITPVWSISGDLLNPSPTIPGTAGSPTSPGVPVSQNGSQGSISASANVQMPWYKNSCVTSGLVNAGVHVGLDLIGLIPEAEGFTKVFANTAGYKIARAVGSSAGYRGVVATQYGIKVVAQGKLAVGTIGGAFGLGDTSVQGRISTGLTVAGLYLGSKRSLLEHQSLTTLFREEGTSQDATNSGHQERYKRRKANSHTVVGHIAVDGLRARRLAADLARKI